MKKFAIAALAATVLTVPLAVSAQTTTQGSTVTRGEVKGDLRNAEANGYNPNGDQNTYPAGIQRADRRSAEQSGTMSYGNEPEGTTRAGANAAYGAAPDGTVQAGPNNSGAGSRLGRPKTPTSSTPSGDH